MGIILEMFLKMIVDDAREIVEGVFGPENAKKVDEIAQKIDPETNKEQFLQECEKIIAMMLGPNIAHQKFQHLY